MAYLLYYHTLSHQSPFLSFFHSSPPLISFFSTLTPKSNRVIISFFFFFFFFFFIFPLCLSHPRHFFFFFAILIPNYRSISQWIYGLFMVSLGLWVEIDVFMVAYSLMVDGFLCDAVIVDLCIYRW